MTRPNILHRTRDTVRIKVQIEALQVVHLIASDRHLLQRLLLHLAAPVALRRGMAITQTPRRHSQQRCKQATCSTERNTARIRGNNKVLLHIVPV
jgi:hypothetical protein